MASTIRILKFWTKYTPKAGATIATDMVEYCAVGMATKSTTVARVKDLSRVIENADPDNVAVRMATERWQIIGPAYEAWKNNQAIPTHGTPLAAWPGLTPEQADIIRNAGLRSVEDVAEAPDSVISRVQLPGVRDIQANAKRFLEARDQAKVADHMAAKDAELAELKAQLEEMREIVIASSQAAAPDLNADGSEKPRRGPGRPRKVLDGQPGEAA